MAIGEGKERKKAKLGKNKHEDNGIKSAGHVCYLV